jgi:hypothetical protein
MREMSFEPHRVLVDVGVVLVLLFMLTAPLIAVLAIVLANHRLRALVGAP